MLIMRRQWSVRKLVVDRPTLFVDLHYFLFCISHGIGVRVGWGRGKLARPASILRGGGGYCKMYMHACMHTHVCTHAHAAKCSYTHSSFLPNMFLKGYPLEAKTAPKN